MNRNHALPSYKLHMLLAPNRLCPSEATDQAQAANRDHAPGPDRIGFAGWPAAARPRPEAVAATG